MSYRKIMVAVILGSLCVSSTAAADMSDSSSRKPGVAWNVADDRKMETNGGIYGPEGLDKYMKRYFDQLLTQMAQLVEQNKLLEKKIDDLIVKNDQALGSQQKKI